MKRIPASYQVIDMLRSHMEKKLKNDPSTAHLKVSDADIARLLEVTPATISGYKSGKDVMGLATLDKANERLEMYPQQLADICLSLAYDGTKNERSKRVLAAVLDMVRGHAPGILLACATLFGAFHSPSVSATSANISERGSIGRVIHYACCALRRRWLMAAHLRHWFATWFPVVEPAGALCLA